MDRTIHLAWMLSIGLCAGLIPEAIASSHIDSDAVCGQMITKRDVLVLNLESMRFDPEKAQRYIIDHAGEFRLLSSDIEEIITRSRASKDPYSTFRGAQKLGVKQGCDLVLVLKTGLYFGRQRGRNSRMKDKGYAWVVTGQRISGR